MIPLPLYLIGIVSDTGGQITGCYYLYEFSTWVYIVSSSPERHILEVNFLGKGTIRLSSDSLFQPVQSIGTYLVAGIKLSVNCSYLYYLSDCQLDPDVIRWLPEDAVNSFHKLLPGKNL